MQDLKENKNKCVNIVWYICTFLRQRDDVVKKTPEQISRNMRKIKNKDSDIEIILRKELWSRGLHYRKNVKSVFGTPDIAFIGKKIAIFCDSEFWHGYAWEISKDDFKSRREFWIPKIEKNIQRDQEVNEKLRTEGWAVFRFWGREIKKDASGCADIIQREWEKR